MTRDDAERLMRASGWLLIPAPCGRTTYVIFPWFGTAVRDHYRTYRFAVRRDDDFVASVRRAADTYAENRETAVPALSDSEDEERQAQQMRDAVTEAFEKTIAALMAACSANEATGAPEGVQGQ